MLRTVASITSILGLEETLIFFSTCVAAMILGVSRVRPVRRWDRAIRRVAWLPTLVAAGLLTRKAYETWHLLALLEEGGALSEAQRDNFEHGFVIKMIRWTLICCVATAGLCWINKWRGPIANNKNTD